MDNDRINRAVGAELRAARARRGWSRDELEKESGVKAASLRRYEDGSRSVPVDTLVKLLSALKISVIDIDAAIRAADLPDEPKPASAIRTLPRRTSSVMNPVVDGQQAGDVG